MSVEPAEPVSLEASHDAPHVDAEEEPAHVEEAFVTETMAELYLSQGHLESAMDIYRKLVEQRPSDDGLRDRLHAVEAQVFEQHHQAVEMPEPVSDWADSAASETAYARHGLLRRRRTPVRRSVSFSSG